MKIPRTHGDLTLAAQQQVVLLLSSARRFDAGEPLEFLSMATRLRVLLHRTRTSHAVLGQLGLLDQPIFVASGADLVPEDYLPKHALTFTVLGGAGQGRFFPRFNDIAETFPFAKLPLRAQIHRLTHKIEIRDGGRGRGFDDWWAQPIIRDAERRLFTREFVVTKTANQDGGAHVDPSLDEALHVLTRANSMGMFSGDDAFESPVPGTVRQIAWEVHSMLYEHAPDLLALAGGEAPPERFPVPS